MRYLVEEEGADANMASLSGTVPIVKAASRGHLGVVKYEFFFVPISLVPFSPYSPLLFPFFPPLHRIDRDRYLIESAGVSADHSNAMDAVTPLWAAARAGQMALVEYLVKSCDANVELANVDGLTPLMAAVLGGKVDVIRFLCAEGKADANVKEKKGDTAIIIAAGIGTVDVCRALVEAGGADATVPGRYGDTALIVACKGGHLPVVKFLIESAGASVGQVNEAGMTPVYCSAEYGQLRVLQYLLTETKGSLEVPAGGGYPIHAAAARGRLEIVTYLIVDRGVPANLADNKGMTPLDIAEKCNQEAVSAYLLSYASKERRARFKKEHPETAPALLSQYKKNPDGEGATFCFCFRLRPNTKAKNKL